MLFKARIELQLNYEVVQIKKFRKTNLLNRVKLYLTEIIDCVQRQVRARTKPKMKG